MKDFDKWNNSKKDIELNDNYLPLYHERQIRWCTLGLNIGSEQNGTGAAFSRPVLIIKGFSRHVCLVVPLTTSIKKHKYLVPLGIVDGKYAQVIISQIRLIDTKRLGIHITTLKSTEFNIVKKAIRNLFQ